MSEKGNIQLERGVTWGKPVRRRNWRLHNLLIVLALSLILYFNYGPLRIGFRSPSSDSTARESKQSLASDPFGWPNITASKDLVYHDCFENLQCARLLLPLDYWNGTNPDKTISLGVLRVPAKVPVTDPRYNGPIYINPGGPGGSGTLFAQGGGSGLQRYVDSGNPIQEASANSTDRFHDIIGFDPRGIFQTTPSAFCVNDTQYRWMWSIRIAEEGIPGSSNAALGRLLSMNKAFSEACNVKATSDSTDILNYISTAHVARDMLELAKEQDEWLKKEKARLIPASYHRVTHPHGVEVEEHDGKKHSKVKVDYWGFSYGTLLGNVFASMFPDHVGHMILDGVLEPVDFTQGHWVGSVTDTEKALDSFYQHCAAAGPSGSNGCSLATNGSIAADIRERFQTILTKLYHNPFPVQAPYGPEVMTYSVLKGFTFSTLYSPVIAFRILSDLFRGLEGGDVAAVADLMVETGLHRKEPPKYAMLGTDAGQAVECADADPFDDYDTAYWQQYYREINGVSPLGGGLLTSLHLRCAGWKTRNVRNEQWGGNTSTPILWIGNTADPICPIKSAFHQAEKFPGSVVLTHDTTGHCSIAAYSHCTTAAIRAYFHNGTLPEPDTVCGVTQFPFDTPAPGQKTENSSDVVVQDVEIAAAHGEVQKAFIDLKMGYGMPQL